MAADGVGVDVDVDGAGVDVDGVEVVGVGMVGMGVVGAEVVDIGELGTEPGVVGVVAIGVVAIVVGMMFCIEMRESIEGRGEWGEGREEREIPHLLDAC